MTKGGDDNGIRGLVGSRLEFLGQSPSVLRRVKALKKLQLEEINLESMFQVRLNELEREFQPLFQRINKKRKDIVNGEHEPEDDECDAPIFHGMVAEDMEKLEKMMPQGLDDVKGVPEFWLDVLLNCYEVEELLQGEDLEILKHLTDITSDLHENDLGFTLSFHFSENPYFTNRVLKKSYVMASSPDSDMPLDYDGPVLNSAKADVIDWIRASSVSGGKRNIHGELVRSPGGVPSFFEFFDPAEKVYSDEMGEDEEAEMERDFEIALTIRDSIIPKAVLYLTDEIMQCDGLDSFEGDTSSDEGSDGGDENMED